MAVSNRQSGMSRGHLAQVLLLLGGVWLVIAPTWIGFSHQRTATHVDEWAGLALIGVSVVSWVVQWAFGLSDWAHRPPLENGEPDQSR